MGLKLLISLGGILALSACNCGGGTGGSGGGSGSVGGGSGSVGGGSGSVGGGSGSVGGGSGSVGGGSGGSGGHSGGAGGSGPTAEVCDGIDNDQNGIIDDVDVGMDGVCDCLKIATLGYAGQWGTGNVFSNWLNGKSIAGAVGLEDQTITAALLAPFQVLVIQDVSFGIAGQKGVGKGIGRSYSPDEVVALKAWVEAGGGVMTLIGYAGAAEITNVNLLLAPFGLAYDSTPILPRVGGSTVPVTHWATHPLSAGIMKIGVDNGYGVTGGGTLVGWEPQPGAADAARAVEKGLGHVFVWCDEWITYDSEWTAHPDYQVEHFWLNSLKWLTPINQCQVPIPVIN